VEKLVVLVETDMGEEVGSLGPGSDPLSPPSDAEGAVE
jgi:hypothetical protein